MKFKLKVMVAAVAFAAAGTASAALDLLSSQNGSLVFVGLDSVGSPISTFIDLNYNLNQFLPTSVINTPNTTIQWNFRTNSLSLNGVAQAGTFAWSDPFASFAATAQNTDVRWAVISGDSVSGQRYITTGNPTQGQLNLLTLSLASGMAGVNNLYAANSALPGPGSTLNAMGVDAGAATATSGNPYVGGTLFGTEGRWISNLPWTSFANAGASNNFQFINVFPRTPGSIFPTTTTYGLPDVDNVVPTGLVAQFSYDDGVLTWTTPVPEPSTYAMLFAGLAGLGFMVRRRRGS